MERLRIPTFRQVWQVERVLYRIEGIRLPVAITFSQAGVFAVAVVGVSVLSRLPALEQISPVVRYLVAPGAITWYLTKQSVDGRPPHLWARSQLRYWLSPRRLLRFRAHTVGRRRIRLTGPVFTRVAKDEEGSRAVSHHLS